MTTLDAKVQFREADRTKVVSGHAFTPSSKIFFTAPPTRCARAGGLKEAAQRTQRLSAITADASATAVIDLGSFWRNLARGTIRIDDAFFSQESYFLLFAKRPGVVTRVGGRRLKILEAVLSGVRQKNIAIDLKLSASTVALNCALGLASFGADCKPSRAHPLLMLAARVAYEGVAVAARHSTIVGLDGQELQIISLCRSEQSLTSRLPSAELEVIRYLVEGLPHTVIAAQRRVSVRTVANQISSVFRRLRVSGRNELVQRLFDERPELHALELTRETLIPTALGETPAPELDCARQSA